jgi:hypothetical protein
LNYIQAQHWFRQISVSRFTLYCSQHSHAYHTTHWPQICSISQAVCRCRGTQVNAFHSAKGNPSSQNACHQAANVKASLAKHCFQVNGLSWVHHAHSFLCWMVPVQLLKTFYDAHIKCL